MKKFVVDSNYHQLYVADRILEPDAPTNWTQEHVKNHHLTELNISALQTENDLDARITGCGPEDAMPTLTDKVDFEVKTKIIVPSKKVGIYGWPWELEDQYDLKQEVCEILFRGYLTDKTETDQDYYLIKISEPATTAEGAIEH